MDALVNDLNKKPPAEEFRPTPFTGVIGFVFWPQKSFSNGFETNWTTT